MYLYVYVMDIYRERIIIVVWIATAALHTFNSNCNNDSKTDEDWFHALSKSESREMFLQELDYFRCGRALLHPSTYSSMIRGMKIFLDYCHSNSDVKIVQHDDIITARGFEFNNKTNKIIL